MASVLFSGLLATLVCHVTLAGVVGDPSPPEGCLKDGVFHPLDDTWAMGCDGRCECTRHNDGTIGVVCVPMCSPVGDCPLVYKLTRDVATSTDCCPLPCNNDGCYEGDTHIPEGILLDLGDQYCGCSSGNKMCFPKL